jgi:hypothetical protein
VPDRVSLGAKRWLSGTQRRWQMFDLRFGLRRCLPIALGLFTLAVPARSGSRFRIASVPTEYTPTAGPGLPEPVSMQGYYFEVDEQSGRARIVVNYTYPDQPVFGLEGGSGPEPSMIQIPGLRYAAEEKAVVYQNPAKTVICASVKSRKFLFWKRLAIIPTGACAVSSQAGRHMEDNGWRVYQDHSIDTFFEVK